MAVNVVMIIGFLLLLRNGTFRIASITGTTEMLRNAVTPATSVTCHNEAGYRLAVADKGSGNLTMENWRNVDLARRGINDTRLSHSALSSAFSVEF